MLYGSAHIDRTAGTMILIITMSMKSEKEFSSVLCKELREGMYFDVYDRYCCVASSLNCVAGVPMSVQWFVKPCHQEIQWQWFMQHWGSIYATMLLNANSCFYDWNLITRVQKEQIYHGTKARSHWSQIFWPPIFLWLRLCFFPFFFSHLSQIIYFQTQWYVFSTRWEWFWPSLCM